MDLQAHLAQEHKISNAAAYISEIVYGGVDGIVTTFAVVAGFVGAGSASSLGAVGPLAVVVFGLANLLGDGVSMALGKYIATKSEQDVYQRAWDKELHEIVHNTRMEQEESEHILMEQGMNPDDARHTVAIMQKYPQLWIKRMMDNELSMADVRQDSPIMQGLITLFAFVFFGAIPLVPYLFLDTGYDYWSISLGMTMGALTLLGVVRWYITRIAFVQTVAQIVILGAVAACVAYWTGDVVMRLY